jgi:hypothetical protein
MSDIYDHVRAARDNFVQLDAKTQAWVAQADEARVESYETNLQWFTKGTVYESSIFLYFDLASSPEAVEYASKVQRVCLEILGQRGFNAAPADRLHATLFTEIVVPNAILPLGQVADVEAKYSSLIAQMRRGLIFLVGPWLTSGGVVLECRTYDSSVRDARKMAARMSTEGNPPRIPNLDYSTIGYITDGPSGTLKSLYLELEELRNDVKPIPIEVNSVVTTLTINKALVQPTLVSELRLPPVPPPVSGDLFSGYEWESRERQMLALAREYGISGSLPR